MQSNTELFLTAALKPPTEEPAPVAGGRQGRVLGWGVAAVGRDIVRCAHGHFRSQAGPLECTGCVREFISADLYSFLECRTTSAFPATAEVIGSWSQAATCRNTGAVPAPAPRGRTLGQNSTVLGLVTGCAGRGGGGSHTSGTGCFQGLFHSSPSQCERWKVAGSLLGFVVG